MADLILGRIDGDVPVLIPTAECLPQSAADRGGTNAASLYEAQALSNLGLDLVWSGRVEEGEQPLRVSLGVAADTGAELTLVNSLGYLALVEWERGHLHAAREIARRALETLQQRDWTVQAQAITVHLVLARVDLEQDHPDTAQMFLDAAMAAHRNDPDRTPYPALQATQARLWLAAGRVDRATDVLVALHAQSQGAGTRRCSSGGSRLPPPRSTWPAIVQKLPYADVVRC